MKILERAVKEVVSFYQKIFALPLKSLLPKGLLLWSGHILALVDTKFQ